MLNNNKVYIRNAINQFFLEKHQINYSVIQKSTDAFLCS
jgi:hypothetical protein